MAWRLIDTTLAPIGQMSGHRGFDAIDARRARVADEFEEPVGTRSGDLHVAPVDPVGGDLYIQAPWRHLAAQAGLIAPKAVGFVGGLTSRFVR